MKNNSKTHIIYIIAIIILAFLLWRTDKTQRDSSYYDEKVDSLNIVIENYYDSIGILDNKIININDKLDKKQENIDSLLKIKNDRKDYEDAKIDIINLDNAGKLELLRKRVR